MRLIKIIGLLSFGILYTATNISADILVRVLLASVDHAEPTHWYIESSGGGAVQITAPGIARKRAMRIRIGTKDGLIINGRCVQGETLILTAPEGESLLFQENNFAGSLYIIREKDRTLCINSVPLEIYTTCVLRTESWPGWPLEVNKALAVASRTYVIDKILAARRHGRAYHIKNTTVHQTYKGLHTRTELQEACAQTTGLFIAHGGVPAEAMFDSCCGGVTPALMHDAHKLPFYLRRDQHCIYCKDSRAYAWHAEYSGAELADALRAENYISGKGDCSHVKITRTDRAGLVQEIACTIMGRVHVLTRTQLYRCFKKLRSSIFTVKKNKNTFIFEGRGIGHHLGLCQWGARELVDRGWSWQRILKFYYPGTTLMRVRLP